MRGRADAHPIEASDRVKPREALSMEYLSEDPTYLAGGLGLLAGAFLIAVG